jgi:lipopolysaccharide export system permease protein
MRILSYYIGLNYLKWFVVILLGLLATVFVFDAIELLRRAASKEVTYDIILTMAFLNLPTTGQKILPFIALFAAMLTLWRLTRTQELVIVRAVGVSVWRFLAPILLVTAALSLFYLFAINPLGALMKKSYHDLEEHYLERSEFLDLSSSGLWLRQSSEGKRFLLHADQVTLEPLVIKPVIAFVFDDQNHYLGRIDAEKGVLNNHFWDIQNAWFNWKGKKAEKVASYHLPTDLTMEKIQESMESPGSVSFWELPEFIRALEATGFSGIHHRMQFYSLLAQPLFLCAMVLFAACFSMRMARRGGVFVAIMLGLFVGSFAFGFNDVIMALGSGQSLPVVLAAFAVPVIALSGGATALLHLEDG